MNPWAGWLPPVPANGKRIGETVFVPGATCFGDIRGFSAARPRASSCPRSAQRQSIPTLGERGVLLALAATARHAIAGAAGPDLIVGHGVLGRLLARLVLAAGDPPPVVWETNPRRMDGALGYEVVHPDSDPRQ